MLLFILVVFVDPKYDPILSIDVRFYGGVTIDSFDGINLSKLISAVSQF